MDATASPDGLLAVGSGGSSDLQLIWVDRGGKQLDTLADKLTNLQTARISPQGDRVALQIDTGENDIWVLDVARGVRTRLTFGNASSTFPVWSPDGKWIAYSSDRNGRSNLYRKPSDGSGAEELLLTDDPALRPDDWSRDGKNLLYSRGGGIDAEIWALPLEGERKPWLVIPHAAVLFGAQLSPDGRWLAYSSDESGVVELYVVPFRGGQGKWQLTAHGGAQPQWSRDGKQLYFMDPSYNLFTVPVKDVGRALQFGAPQRLVSSSSWSAPQVFYDVAPDGKKILLNRVAQQVGQSITVVTNFAAELKK
jgi:Tol biopolymer transport system component